MLETAPAKPPRLGSIDACRGLVMVLMLGEVLNFAAVSETLPESGFWRFLAWHQHHVAWAGGSLHDLIQPSFSFLVGVALPFSLASRASHGQPEWKMTLHACWRALVLVLLGVFLRSIDRDHTVWTFEDTLSQIGLGYPVLYWLGRRSARVQGIALAVILVGYWAAWALYPLPGTNDGFAVHWNKLSNPGVAFDRWFLNLFPRPEPFTANGGGYLTLNFIPTLGTMLLGLIAGRWLRAGCPAKQLLRKLAVAGVIGIGAGWLLHVVGICPVVKRVWTPSWTLASGGACFLMLAVFYALIDVRGWRKWAYPLVVVGANSMAAYLMAHLMEGFLRGSFATHFGPGYAEVFGGAYAPVVSGFLIFACFWMILWWMYRGKIFLKV
ncbi:DUF5009 domain-containing protein [Luteolibacter sp. LG18]|uniref:acyltransferase family protein n=1 Tax=Luteolibacter sp. LG18 TaxID=2819286 RepID=UPI002B2C806D|nr:DUF5009 domain-containing protein [Luteolibacter sp. LG18]